ncbi:uncharacterized protein LOC119739247 [Patiria miniata]|uniref:Uncharacterized protein n=1 Tax=Patiria miniata TaxID=46514 RepID=A0A914B295_PATMI|nr:uncharacterized protein LOC119739247 [Patiria miniata]
MHLTRLQDYLKSSIRITITMLSRLFSGGGPKPPVNSTYELVLDALLPVGKDGIVEKYEGETMPDLEFLLGSVEKAITCSDTIDTDVDMEEVEEVEPVQVEPEEVEKEIEREKGECSTASSRPPVQKKKIARDQSILQIERERLQIDKEKLKIARQQLEASQAMTESLKEISHSFQILVAFTLEKHGAVIVSES